MDVFCQITEKGLHYMRFLVIFLCEIFQNSCFTEHIRMTTFVYLILFSLGSHNVFLLEEKLFALSF